MGELEMQCAWCRRCYDAWGLLTTPLPSLVPEASHGLCVVCLCQILRARSESLRRKGDVDRADGVERERLAVLGRFARLRRVLPAGALERYRRTRELLEGLPCSEADPPRRSVTRAAGRPRENPL